MRRIVFALASALALFAASASAADAAPLPVTSVTGAQSCLAAGLGSANRISLTLAQSCAPRGATIAPDGSGYSISFGQVVSAASSCSTHTYYQLHAGITDRLTEGGCWDGHSAWISWTRSGCYPFLPGAGCFWTSDWHNNSYGYVAFAHAWYAQNCVFSIPCDGSGTIALWFDGSWNAWNGLGE